MPIISQLYHIISFPILQRLSNAQFIIYMMRLSHALKAWGHNALRGSFVVGTHSRTQGS